MNEQTIFVAALDLADPVERADYLARACKGDDELRHRVGALLKSHEEAGSFMGSSEGSTAATQDAAAGRDALRFGRSPSASIEDPLAEKPGAVIGNYKLLQQIGQGGFGVVWMADQEKPVRRRVALKIIKMGMDTKEVIARFEQERQALAMMDHPNIARVLDAGATQSGRPYFVMELVRGVKITEYCDEQGLSTVERIELFVTVCQAVQHAHQKGIIHRDLKPSNILVTINDGEAVPKVIDFGVAKATQGRITDGTLFTKFEQMIGTPLYMSPEQAEITSLDVDTRSDIYSLGVLLYELLTGRTPIDTATMARAGMDEVRRLIREVDPPRPSARLKTLAGTELTTMAKRRHTEPTKLSSGLRGDIDWIVMKCLEKDRKRRYDTANGLALDLQRHLSNDVVMARPPTTAYLLSKLIRRNKLACVAGTAIVLSLVIGIAASAWQAVRATRAERRSMNMLDELRATAPAFAEQAHALAAKEQFDDAIAKLDYAVKLRPDVADYLVAKGDLLQCQRKLTEATTVYREALSVKPGLARAEASAKLCDELLAARTTDEGKLTRESLAKLLAAMQKQQRPAAELMPVARLLGEEKQLLVEYWLARLKDLPVSAEQPLKDRLTVREDGRLALDLSDTHIADLAPLAGMPLGGLTLSGCSQIADFSPLHELRTLTQLGLKGTKIADLSSLSGLQLETLNLDQTDIFDIAALRGMKLKRLSLRTTRIADLSPLAGMPLASFDALGIPAIDYAPLAGAPFESCSIQSSPVHDLSFLRDAPVKELVLYGCEDARGYAVLAGLKSLNLLILPTRFRDLPKEELAAIGALREHPALRNIQAPRSRPGDRVRSAAQSKEIFWQDWDREHSFIARLGKAGVTGDLVKRRDDGTWEVNLGNTSITNLDIVKGEEISRLDLYNTAVSDLSPLHGMPIKELILNSTKVTDLSSLQGMPLTVLTLTETPVSDLAALRGMPIKTLHLSRSKLTDLSPLNGMPLEDVRLCEIPATDLSPLADAKKLTHLVLPPNAKNIEFLRAFPALKRVSFKEDQKTWIPAQTAEEFWKEYDEKAK